MNYDNWHFSSCKIANSSSSSVGQARRWSRVQRFIESRPSPRLNGHWTAKQRISVNPGKLGGTRPPDFGMGVVGVVDGHGRDVKYYYYRLSCTGIMFESGDFSRKIEQFVYNVGVNGHFLLENDFFK